MDDDEAALALIAHFTDISTARVKHALACRHFVTTGDRTRIDAYFRADDIGPDQDFTPETVAAARQQVERMRMLEWEIIGAHPGDTDPDTATLAQTVLCPSKIKDGASCRCPKFSALSSWD